MTISASKSNCRTKGETIQEQGADSELTERTSNGRPYRADTSSDVKGLLAAAHCEAEGQAASVVAATDDKIVAARILHGRHLRSVLVCSQI